MGQNWEYRSRHTHVCPVDFQQTYQDNSMSNRGLSQEMILKMIIHIEKKKQYWTLPHKILQDQMDGVNEMEYIKLNITTRTIRFWGEKNKRNPVSRKTKIS